jgi:hypothetical protein
LKLNLKPSAKLLFTAVVFAVMFFMTQTSFALGFAAGNEFQASSSSGHITVTCQGPEGPATTVNFDCWNGSLSPVEYDYFLGPTLTADSVNLTVTREDQSQRSKDSRYDSRRGMSVDRFNLWVASLFQRPLLADGVNRVHYSLKLKGASVDEGDFVVKVVREPTAVCPNHSYTSKDPADCTNQYSMCGKYFEEFHYCH